MASGQPLDDADRAPWLAAIGAWMDARARAGEPGVVSCSALKRAYRDTLRAGRPQARIVYLHGTEALIAEVIPEVEKSYHVMRDRNARAITGLSMGGGESLEKIQAAVCAEFDVAPDEALAGIKVLVKELAGKKLLLAV